MAYDEFEDSQIAKAMLQRPEGWLRGSGRDLSQTRLPMAIPALCYALTGRSDLVFARGVSAVLGALAIAGVFVYALLFLDRRRAVVATLALAASPYFFAFARVGFTECDVTVAATLLCGQLSRP